MAKRGRAASVDKLLSRLKQIDNERKTIMASIKAAVSHVIEAEAPAARKMKKAATDLAKSGVEAAGVLVSEVKKTRKRRKMSAAARAKISAAQKKRWAKQKAK